MDFVGALLATTGLGGLVYGLIESSASGFGAPVVLAALVLGAIALLGLVFVERRGKDPMMPPSLFRSRNFDGANLLTLLFYMAPTGSLYFLPFLMMQVHGYSAFVAGTVFLPFVAMAFLLGRLSGRICAPLYLTAVNVRRGTGSMDGVQNFVEFVELNIRTDLDAMQEMVEFNSQFTPTTVIDGEIFIGFDKEKISEQLGL